MMRSNQKQRIIVNNGLAPTSLEQEQCYFFPLTIYKVYMIWIIYKNKVITFHFLVRLREICVQTVQQTRKLICGW